MTRPPRYFEPPTYPIRTSSLPPGNTSAPSYSDAGVRTLDDPARDGWTHRDHRRTGRPSRPQRARRIDPAVVIAAIMMTLLAAGVVVGLATM